MVENKNEIIENIRNKIIIEKSGNLRPRWENKLSDEELCFIDNYFSDCNRKESLWRLLHGINEAPLCPICGKKAKFYGIKNMGYHQTCGDKYCYGRNNQNQVVKTLRERYGVEVPMRDPSIREKYRQTMLEKYGYEHNWQLPEEQAKSHSDEAKQKMRKTCLERYGVPVSSMAKSVKEKVKQTNLERYGVKCTFDKSGLREQIYSDRIKNMDMEDLKLKKNHMLF